jgi:hypothetical protein
MTRQFSSTPEINALAAAAGVFEQGAGEAIELAMFHATEVDKILTPAEAAALGAAAVENTFARACKAAMNPMHETSRGRDPHPRLDEALNLHRAKPDGTLDFSEVDRGTEAEIRADERRRIVA